METRASKSSVVNSVKGLFQEDASVIHQNIDGSEVVDCCFDRIGSSLLLADIAIEENQAARSGQLSIGVDETLRRRYNLLSETLRLNPRQYPPMLRL